MYHSEMLCCALKRKYKIHPLYKVNGNDYFLKSTKGQLILKGIFGVFKSIKKPTNYYNCSKLREKKILIGQNIICF